MGTQATFLVPGTEKIDLFHLHLLRLLISQRLPGKPLLLDFIERLFCSIMWANRSLGPTLDIKEHKQQQDIINDPELANGVIADVVAPVATAAEVIPLQEPVGPPAFAPPEEASQSKEEDTAVPAMEEESGTVAAPDQLKGEDTAVPAMEEEAGTVAAPDPPHYSPEPVTEGVEV